MIVTDLLVESFPEVMDIKFTASMEDKLDNVEDGSVDWVKLLEEFYTPFRERLDSAAENMRNVKAEVVATDIVCEKCGAKMIIRWGRNGRFLACSAFPECRNGKPFTTDEDGKIKVVEEIVSDQKCDKCDAAMIVKSGRRGRFLACSAYPKCRNTAPVPIGVDCPKAGCSGQLVERQAKSGKTFYSCNQYPECRFSVFQQPRIERCDTCDEEVKVTGRQGAEEVFACSKSTCPHAKSAESE
jgi:DNA topoisomerase-1